MQDRVINRHPKHGEELMSDFLTQVNDLMEEYKEKMKYHSRTGQDSDAEKLHSTLRLLQRFFNTRGGLPV